MAMNDTLANALSKIRNAENSIKDTVRLHPISKIIKTVLDISKDHGYVGSYEIKKTNQGDVMTLNLISKINKCGAIKPRYPVTLDEYEKFEKRYLPAKDFGILFVSTTKGIMTHKDAKKNKLGGILIAYIY